MYYTLYKGVDNTKKLILLIGCSTSGKNTFRDFLQILGIPKLISHTTRPIRQGEVNGETYHYITEKEFKKLDKLEYTYYAGNYYGLSREEIEKHNEDLVCCIVDIKGVESIRKNYGKENIVVINLNISLKEMVKRLYKRGSSEEEISERIKYTLENDEIKNDFLIADYTIRNNDFTKAKQMLVLLINKLKLEV